MGADGEEIIARTSQQHIFVFDTPEQHAAVRKLADGDSFAEIRRWSILCITHLNLPSSVADHFHTDLKLFRRVPSRRPARERRHAKVTKKY
jgi:hypothetical protein